MMHPTDNCNGKYLGRDLGKYEGNVHIFREYENDNLILLFFFLLRVTHFIHSINCFHIQNNFSVLSEYCFLLLLCILCIWVYYYMSKVAVCTFVLLLSCYIFWSHFKSIYYMTYYLSLCYVLVCIKCG